MSRLLTLAFLFLSFAAGAARACDGQAGSVIFEDNFEDDSGGWQLSPPEVVIKPPDLLLGFSAKTSGETSLLTTFNATDGDYCVQAIVPKTPAPDNQYGFGIALWATDYSNLYLVQVSSAAMLSMYKKSQGNWTTVFSNVPVPSYKADADAVNALRVVAKDGKLTISVNGATVKAIRAQTPAGPQRFGVYGQMDKGLDGVAPIRIKTFKVTSGS